MKFILNSVIIIYGRCNMNFITNYFNLQKEIKEYEKLYKRVNTLNKMSEHLKNYDLLIEKFNVIKKYQKNKLDKTLDELLLDTQNRLKLIYSRKMNTILSKKDIEISLGFMRGFLEDLNSYNSINFNGLVISFITDVTRVIKEFNIIHNNFQNSKNYNILEYADPLFKDAVKYAIENGEISASLLQRKFVIGYNRALRLIDVMEEKSIIGPKGNPREVLINSLEDILFDVNIDYFSLTYGLQKEETIDEEKDLLYKIDNEMNGYEFESLTKEILLKNNFYDVTVTKASCDFGVDVIAYKDSVKYAIQCKKYSSTVGIKAVQEIIASRAMNNCHVAVVLTNNYFTEAAKELALKNNCLLWDRDVLVKMINKYEER